MTITRFRKGQLSVPLLYCPNIDSLVGNMTLLRAGVAVYQAQGARTVILGGALMCNTNSILDSSAGEIVGSDGAGHIDALGDVTDLIRIAILAGTAYCGYATGAVTYGPEGEIITAVNNDIRFGLTLPNRLVNMELEVASVTIGYSTNNNNAYITATSGYVYPIDWGASTQIINDATDRGNGVGGKASYSPPIIADHDLDINPILFVRIDTIVGAGSVRIFGFDILLKQKD